MTVAVIFHRFGPYHVARLRAAARCGRIVGIELSAASQEYAWDAVPSGNEFARCTISADESRLSRSALAKRLGQALENAEPSAVFINGWSSAAAALALLWCQRRRIPAVVMSDSTVIDEPRRFWKEMVKRQIVQCFAAGLVAGSRHADYVTSLGLPRDRVFIGYDAVDNDYFAQRADAVRRQSEFTRERFGLPEHFFLASSRFIPKKNLPGLLRAYAMYRNSTGEGAWHLIVLGDGPGRAELERVCAELGLTSWVQMPGFKQYDELPAFYGLAGAFVHASTSEQWGLVVNEAMAAGLPVLVSDRCGCAPDLVKPGVTGFTFEPTALGDLAELMTRLAADEALRASMGAAARQVVQSCSPEVFAEGVWKATAVAQSSPLPNPGVFGRLAVSILSRRWS